MIVKAKTGESCPKPGAPREYITQNPFEVPKRIQQSCRRLVNKGALELVSQESYDKHLKELKKRQSKKASKPEAI